jgi:hypothetical protein
VGNAVGNESALPEPDAVVRDPATVIGCLRHAPSSVVEQDGVQSIVHNDPSPNRRRLE